MSEESTKKHTAVIFPALWKPNMIVGLPQDYLMLVVICSLIPCVIKKSFLYLFLVAPLMWLLGYIWAKSDPEFLTVWLVKLFKVQTTKRNSEGNDYYP